MLPLCRALMSSFPLTLFASRVLCNVKSEKDATNSIIMTRRTDATREAIVE